ncbi:hypothetical protein BH23GEM8_BH23GEM8_01490 [soil metagenome]
MINLPTARHCTLATMGLLLAASPLESQNRSVTWVETTRLETAGTLGTVLQAMPGGLTSRRSEQGLHLLGGKLRQDGGSSSMILDLDNRRWTSLDHDARAYTSMSFAQSAEMIRTMAAGAGGEMDQARAEMRAALAENAEERERLRAEMRGAAAEVASELRFDVEVRPTSETRRFGSFSAKRYLLIAQISAPDGVDGVEDQGGGGLAFVVERWQSEDFPSADAAYERWAHEMASDPAMQSLARDMAGSLEPISDEIGSEVLSHFDPRIAGGLQRLAEEASKLTGVSLQTTTAIAFLPTGVPLEVNALLEWRPDSAGDVVRAQAGQAAANAARGAVRGLTRGMLGRGQQQQAQQQPAVIQNLLRIVNEVTEVQDHGAPAPSRFEIAPGYTERAIPGLPSPGR